MPDANKKPGGTRTCLPQTPRLSGAKHAMQLPLVQHTGKQILDRAIDPSARGGALLHSDSQSSWIGTGTSLGAARRAGTSWLTVAWSAGLSAGCSARKMVVGKQTAV